MFHLSSFNAIKMGMCLINWWGCRFDQKKNTYSETGMAPAKSNPRGGRPQSNARYLTWAIVWCH